MSGEAVLGRQRLDVPAILLLLLVVSYPVNYSLFLRLRIADFVILAFLFATLPRVRFQSPVLVALVLLFFALYGASAAYGSFTRGITTASNFQFAYKYAIAFMLFAWLNAQRFPTEVVDRVARASFVIYALLVAWVFARLVLWTRGLVSGHLRVAFPFSNEAGPSTSDAPLYSVVLATCFTGYFFYPARTRRRRLRSLVALTATAAAIISSGSRTGLIAMAVVLLLAGTGRALAAVREGRIRLSPRDALLVAVAAAAVAIVVTRVASAEMGALGGLITRVFSLDVAQDASVTSRLVKTSYVLSNILLGPIFIGLGMQSTFHIWFDNAYAGVLFATGLVGLTVLLAAIAVFLATQRAAAWRNGTMAWYRGLWYLFVSYLVSGFSSEFFLVTRGLVPFVALCMVYVHHIHVAGEVPAPAGAEVPG